MSVNIKNKAISISLSLVISAGFTYWGVQGIGAYGLALFVLTPLFLGICPVVIYGWKQSITMRQARNIGLLTLGFFTAALIVFAFEGLICIAMAAPIGLLLTWLGTLIGYRIIGKSATGGMTIVVVLMLMIPATAFMDRKENITNELIHVTTSIQINATPESVWKNVVEFPTLADPTEFIFRAGIAYPINAEIKGKGIGAIRYCNFSTGNFVEPITIWDEPNVLKFEVSENPAPMKELSFYDINAPHLHDYFVSKQGQFKLRDLGGGKTLLEGTTWYYHNIRPQFYWRLWSDYIIHKIHLRVLTHIKDVTESDNRSKL